MTKKSNLFAYLTNLNFLLIVLFLYKLRTQNNKIHPRHTKFVKKYVTEKLLPIYYLYIYKKSKANNIIIFR
jgi:hypothetical protein